MLVRRSSIVMAVWCGVAVGAGAQRAVPAADPRVAAALDAIKSDNAWTVEQQISLCGIPAPPFKESIRAAEFKKRLESLGLLDVHTDAVGNVVGRRAGSGTGPTIVLAGHLDTVFPEGTDVTLKRVGDRLAAPGIGDDCRGLAVLLAVARAFDKAGVQTVGTVYFVGDVGEEGEGNLRGMRELFNVDLKGKVDDFISVDSPGLFITNRAVGSIRYKVTYAGPGGHSYGAFGIPNPIHALGRAIAAISDLRVPTSPKTTFNVGVISGGTSVNSISATGSAEIDLRSESPAELASLDAKVRRILTDAVQAENARWGAEGGASALRLTVDTMGIRPASADQTASSPIVATALAAAKGLGFSPTLSTTSSDANIPMSLHIPAITIGGGGDGANAHSLTEWYEDGSDGWRGPQWAALLVAALAGVR